VAGSGCGRGWGGPARRGGGAGGREGGGTSEKGVPLTELNQRADFRGKQPREGETKGGNQPWGLTLKGVVVEKKRGGERKVWGGLPLLVKEGGSGRVRKVGGGGGGGLWRRAVVPGGGPMGVLVDGGGGGGTGAHSNAL